MGPAPQPLRYWTKATALAGLLCLVGAVCGIGAFGWTSVTTADAVDLAFREGSGRPAEFRPGGLFLEADTYTWLGQVIDHREAGGGRALRWTYRDNTPDGRAVHWASPFLWLLRGTGEIVAAVRGVPFRDGLEAGARWVGPALHLLTVLAGGALLLRRFGLLAAGMFALALVAQRESLWAFHPLRPDHQALYGLTVVLTAILLAGGGLGEAGPAEHPRNRQRRRLWFAAAGLTGALGVWVSATVSVAFHLLLVVAIALAGLLPRLRTGASGSYDPETWRIWGASGAAACLLAWLVEYAPGLPWGRMEVNHPLYALQWLAAGEALRLWTGWRQARTPWDRNRLLGLVAATAGILAAPLLLAFGPDGLHALRDPIIRAIHRHIAEFNTYAELVGPSPFRSFLFTYGPVCVPLLAAPVLAILPGTPAAFRKPLATLWIVAVALLALGLAQARWMVLFAGTLAVLLGLTAAAMAQSAGPGARALRTLSAALVLALFLHAGLIVRTEHRVFRSTLAGRQLDQDFVNSACLKMISLELGRRRGDADWRFMADTGVAPHLHYFAGIPSVGSLYWENGPGMRDVTDFFNDESGETARTIAARRGLTHVMIFAWGDTTRIYHDLADRGPEHDGLRQTIISRLMVDAPTLPLWIMPDVALSRVTRTRWRFFDESFEAPITVHRLDP